MIATWTSRRSWGSRWAGCPPATSCWAGPYVSGDLLVLERDRTGALTLTEAHTRYGVLLNGRRLERPVTLEDMTFFSVANYYFYYRDNCLFFSRVADVVAQGVTCVDPPPALGGERVPALQPQHAPARAAP